MAAAAVVSLKSFISSKMLQPVCYDSNIDKNFRALGWRKLKYQRLESTASMMYKSLHGMTLNLCVLDLFSKRRNIISIKVYWKYIGSSAAPRQLLKEQFLV